MLNQLILTPFMLDQRSAALEQVARDGWRLHVPAVGAGSLNDRLTAIHRSLAGLIAESAGRGERPVSIGGDCCAAVAVLAGLQRAGLAPSVLWLDAHGDFNTWETTVTGFIGGMPLAMLTGRGDPRLLAGAGCHPVEDEVVVLADARDLDRAERTLLESSRVRHTGDLGSIPGLLPADRPVYVHFDLDLLDPGDAPALGYPTPGGPALTAVVGLGQRLLQTHHVAAVSVTAWDPARDPDGGTARACLRAVHAFIEYAGAGV